MKPTITAVLSIVLLWLPLLQQSAAFDVSRPRRATMAPSLARFMSNNPLQQQQQQQHDAIATKTTPSTAAWQTDLTDADLKGLVQTAQGAARAAGQVIVDNLGCASKRTAAMFDDKQKTTTTTTAQVKTSIKDIVTEHDKKAQGAVEGIIRSAYPDHSFLGEEDVDPGAAASAAALTDRLTSTQSGFLWICDPIDGTANFASGLAACAVTVAVVYRGTPIVGVIYDPHANEMFCAIKGQGATVNGQQALHVATGITDVKDAIINAGCPADPSAFDASLRGISALNGQSRGLRMIACSALTTAWIAAGRLTAHFGYDLSSWDLVAGALLIQEAGGLVTDLDGSPYRIETRNMLCSNGLVHEPILQVLKDADAISFTRS